MKQTARIISTYTGDTSGVCSALYELGGMTVMHDASGCNSTYNTHDEPRWYDTDSLVFISALTETQAIMGDDEKLISDMTEAANELSPKFIALAGTPIPMMTGTDYAAIARETQRRTGIPCFGFATDGMHSYVHGASMAFEAIAKHFCKTREEIANDDAKQKGNINVKDCDRKAVLKDEGFSESSSMSGICAENSGANNEHNDSRMASDGGNNGSENACCKGTVDITNGVKDCTCTYERNDTSTSVNMNICGKNSLSDAENTTCNGDARKNNGKNALKNECERIKVNILGVTPLDFSLTGSHLEMKKLLESNGFEVVSVWAMDDTLENIERSSLADVNLVVASCGIKAARVLEKRFAIPFVIGTPFGSFKDNVISAMRKAVAEKKNRISCIEEIEKNNADCEKNGDISCETVCETYCETKNVSQNGDEICLEKDCSCDCNKELKAKTNLKTIIIGESVTALSLARAIEKKYGFDCFVVSAVETEEMLLGKKCVFARDEDEIIPYLKNADVIIADPMYKPICPEDSKFIALPHEAFSGRIYRKDIPELVSGCDAFLEKNF